jgi:hypothetical protein
MSHDGLWRLFTRTTPQPAELNYIRGEIRIGGGCGIAENAGPKDTTQRTRMRQHIATERLLDKRKPGRTGVLLR